MEKFWDFADRLVMFSAKEKEEIAACIRKRSTAKGEVLVDLGEVAREAYFVLSGYLRFFYLTDDGREVTGFIFKPGMFGGSAESFFSQTPSMQIVESITDCELLALPYDLLADLFRTVPRMNVFVRKLLEQRLVYAQRVVASLIIQKHEERYGAFVEEQPDLVRDIPQHILASYLGITPVSLSRIRRRRLDKKG